MANFLDDLSVYNAKAALVISQVVANGDTGKANMMSSLKTTANDTTLSEAIRLNALTALINLGSLLDVPLPPYFPLTTTYANTQTYVGIHDDLTGIQGGAPGDYQHVTTAERNLIANAATLGDITFTNLSGVYTNNANLVNAFAGKQNALSGTGFVKISGTTISYDNSTFLTTISGIAAGGELSGTYPNPALSNAAVISKLLTGFTGVALPTPITSSDTILSAMQKLNNNISSLIVSPSGVASVRLTTNSGGVFTTTTTAQTGTATLDVSLNSQSASRFLASPTSAAGVPTFRAFAATDLPNSGATAGTYGSSSLIPQIIVDAKGRITAITTVAAAAGGQVNSVTLTQPGIFGTVTNIGTASAVNLNYGLSTQTANYVWAGPVSGAAIVPAFRALVEDDIPSLSPSKITGLTNILDGFLTDSLSDGSIWIGNTSNAAVQRVLSGDVTVSNTGVTAIGLAKVQYDMIQDVTTQTLLGRYAAVDGEVQQITLLGTDFVLDSGTGVLSLASPVAPVVTTKGDLLGHDLTSQARLPSSGVDGDLLIVDGADSLGLKWVTAQGDVEVDTTLLDGTFNILPGVVTLGKMATLAANSIIGNNTGSSATPLALTGTQVTAMLDLFSSSTGTKGLVPGSNGNTTYFLRGDLSWQPITGTGTVTSVSVVNANGFNGSVATSTSTPAITISTTVTGILKGNGTAMSAATAGTDFISPGQITQTSGAGSGLTMASGSLLGRTTASAGVIEAISVNSSLTLASTALGLNLGNGNIFTVQQQMPSLRLNGSTSGFVSFTPPAIAGAQVYELPAAVPSGSGQYLTATTGGVLSWSSPAGSGTTTNAVTFNNSGSGAASGTTFDGSAVRTISYNTLGAQQASTNLTGLSALTYASGTPFVKMTAAGTFSLDTNTYISGTATQYALLVGGASNTVASVTGGAAGQVLRYVSGANPAWSTATYPNTTSINRILYSSANDVVDQIVAPSDATFLRYTTAGGYSWQSAVTSLGFGTQGLITNGGTAAAPVLAVSGNSGGVVYFSNATTWASSGTLDQYELVVGGGAGSPPITINNSATAGTILTSNGNSNNPSWTAATYPTSTSINRILFSSANNVIDEIVAPNTADTFLKWDGTTFTWDTAGGGGGSGTVGSGNQYQLAYYNGAGTTTSVIGWTAPTASRALASDANGLPVASATTATELGYLSGATGVAGTGSLVFSASPTFTGTPVLSTATATSINGLTITSSTGTLTIANGSTLATSGAFSTTLTATAPTTLTLPDTGTLATLAGTETFTNKTLNGPKIGTAAGSGHFHMHFANSAPTGLADYITVFGDTSPTKKLGFLFELDTFESYFQFEATTSSKTYTFPDLSGTVALLANAAAFTSVTVGTASSLAGDVVFQNATNATTQTFRGTNPTSSIVYLLPTTAPTAGQALVSTAPSSGIATLSWSTVSGAGVNTMAAIGSTPNANGATISGTTLNLQPADATNGGVVSTAAQTFAGVKTFSSNIIFGGTAAAPTLTTRSGGTKLVLNSTISASALDYAWGVGTGTMWGTLGASTDQFILYAPISSVVTNVFSVSGTGSMTMRGGTITMSTSTIAGNVTGSADTGIFSRNFINLGNGGGTAIPATVGSSWATRSLGSRVIIQATSTTSQADMAIGYNTNEMWMSLFTAASGSSFGWYGAATKIMTLRGDGLLTLTGTLALRAGAAAAGSAPLAFTSGTNLTTPVNGSMEYNGTNLFFTRTGAVREGVLTQSAVTTEVLVSDTSVTINIGGTTYKLLAKA